MEIQASLRGPALEGVDDASRQRFVEQRTAGGSSEPTLLEATGYAEQEFARTGTNDLSSEGLARRQAWIAEQRRMSVELQWEAERRDRQTHAESQARLLKRERTIGMVGMLALLLGLSLAKAGLIAWYFMHLKTRFPKPLRLLISMLFVCAGLLLVLLPDGLRAWTMR